MRISHDAAELENAKRKLDLAWYRDCEDLPFSVYHYEKGEILVAPENPSQHLMICLSGYARMYDLNKESGIIPVGLIEEKGVIGDMEFCRQTRVSYFVETAVPSCFLVLPLSVCREKLNDDPAFLHFLLDSIAYKLSMSSITEISVGSLEDKVLEHLSYISKDHRINGVGDAALTLHCSRRQLQRVLQKLCEEGKLEKEKRGCYCLTGKYSRNTL